MRLLLDTHVALWAITDDPRLTSAASDLIADPANEIFVSTASLWEIAIQHALARTGAHAMKLSAAQAQQYFRSAGYQILDVVAAHVVTVETLPPLHSDPFDRMLIAQALNGPLRLITHDSKLAAYSDLVIRI